MSCDKSFLISGFCFSMVLSISLASTAYYDTTSNLTHTCKITPMVVCVDVVVLNKTCVDPSCVIYSGGNYSTCTLNVTAGNLTVLNNTSGNMTGSNRTVNSTVLTCSATWLYPSNTTFCVNATSWNKTVCGMNNVTCKVNSTHCTLNPVVYVGGFFNLRDKDGYGNLPAANLALNQINNDNKTLENITLSLVAKQSTQSLLSYGTQLLYNYLHSGPTKLMLLLPQESDLARTVAAYAGLKRWGTLQFSYGTKDNSLASNKQLFPRFYRLNPLAITYNRLRAEFVNTYTDWMLDVGLLYYADSYYQEVNDDLKERLKAKGINVVANVGFKSDPAEALYILKEKNAHVILTSFPYWYGKKMFCKAFQLGMYGPHYVWITFVLMPYKFWIPKASDDLECTEDEMTCIAENHFSFYGATLYKTSNYLINEPTVTFSKTYNDLVNSTKNRTSTAPYVYDAIWTMTNILERARPELLKNGKVLNNLSYGEETQLLEKLANETDFNGVTGRIRFYENGNRKFNMQVLQVLRNGFGYVVGSYNEDMDSADVKKKNILWQGFTISEGGWSYRRTTETYKWRYIELPLFIVWCILAILGMLFAIFCLVFVIKYRRERAIKYSSPTINVLIILGCLLNFIAVVLYGVDYQRASESRMTVICKVRLWILSLGFTFCIGGLWVKSWTLYQILIERKVYRKRRMEYCMFAIVMILVVIDVIYLTTWTAIDGLYRSLETVIDQPEYKCFQKLSGNPFISTTWYIEICDCDKLGLWSGLFLTYKALVLLFGAYMAWKVRLVYTRKLVDAQYCATLLLLAVPFCLLGLIFAYTLRLYPTPHYALLGIIIIIYTYIVLGFLYGHKIINIFCCPRNMIKVRSKDDSGRLNCCCVGVVSACCAPIAACFSACCCCICCHLSCCKVLWNALLHGPRKSRGSFVKENEKMDYQIGEMPSDRERQIIILQRQVEKREEELKRLRGNHRATLAVKETQTMDYLYNRGDGSDHFNEGFADEENNNSKNKQRSGGPNHNRFKVYHRKLDFSHVGSKVDSRLDSSRSSTKRDGSLKNNPEEPRPNESEILSLQKTLSERDRELAQLKASLGMDPSSSTECSSKIGSLASIGEEHDLATPSENEVPNRNLSSVAITIQSSDSDDSKQTGSDVSNEDVPSDVSCNDQTVGLLGESKTAVDQELQLGILPDTQPAEKESEVQERKNDKQPVNQNQEKVKPKILTAYDLRGSYVSHYNAKAGGGKFKKKVRQLTSFGILAPKAASDENKVKTDTSNAPVVNVESSDSQASATPKVSPDTGKSTDENNTSGDSGQKSRNDVKIFNASTNWSHVKSRLFDPSSQSSLRPSPNTRRRSKVGIEDYGDQKSGENISYDGNDEKTRNGVKIFNAPSDYSRVKSRVFDPNATSGNQSESNLRPSPNIRRKSKVGTDDEPGEGEAAKIFRNAVKIFNSSTDYSHVKSRLFDPNASGNQVNSDNLLKPSPNIRRKSKVGIDDDVSVGDSSDLSSRQGSVKIINAPSDYSHVKSRLFNSDTPANRRTSQTKPQDINNAINKEGNEQEKENQVSKSRVKIFNAPSDYSHVKSRLTNKTNTADNENKVKQMSTSGANTTANDQDRNTQTNKEESTNV